VPDETTTQGSAQVYVDSVHLRDALYDLHTHSHQPPNGADMPTEYVAFRDVEDLLSRAALDAPALTVERLAEALTEVQGGRYESWLKRAPLILRALGEGAGEGVDR
jgi:hypothetical protein